MNFTKSMRMYVILLSLPNYLKLIKIKEGRLRLRAHIADILLSKSSFTGLAID